MHIPRSVTISAGLVAATFLISTHAASAAPITDPAGDFLSSYTGPQGADLDILSIDPTTDGHTLTLSSTSAGAIGTTAGGIFVWGIDRGTNAAPFGVFRPGVLFDAVVVGNPGGITTVNVAGVSTVLPSSDISIAGNTFSISLPLSLLPSAGFSPFNYLVNLWPRVGSGNNAQIADFAPDNSDARVSFVPEPATVALLLVGLLGVFAFGRKYIPKPATPVFA